MNKQFYYITVFILFVILLGDSNPFAQTINLNGVNVDIAKIPLNGDLPLVINSDLKSTTAESQTPVLFFKTDNNHFFAKATFVSSQLKSTLSSDPCGKIELFDASGNMAWSKTTELPVLNCKISNDGKFCNTILRHWIVDEDDYELLIVLNERGDEIFREMNVDCVYPNYNKDVIYYIKDINGEHFLCFKDLLNSSNWNVPIKKEQWIRSVSDDGYNVILSSNDGLNSYGVNGTLLWNNSSLIGGQVSLSSDGKYLIKCVGLNNFSIYNNEDGTYISTIGNKTFNGELAHPYHSSYIRNSKDKFAVLFYIGPSKPNILAVFDIHANLLQNETIVAKTPRSDFFCEINNDNTLRVYFDGLEVASFKGHF